MSIKRGAKKHKSFSIEEREKIKQGIEGLRKFNSMSLNEPEMSLEQKFDLLDAMHQFSREMGAFSGEDPLQGLEVKIKIAKVVNCVS